MTGAAHGPGVWPRLSTAAPNWVMESDLARGVAAGADRAQMEYLRSEAARARARLERPVALSIAGISYTGVAERCRRTSRCRRGIRSGAGFVNGSRRRCYPAARRRSVGAGQSAAIKLDSYPQHSWHGVVTIVSPQAQAVEGDRTFAARVPLANEDAILHMA